MKYVLDTNVITGAPTNLVRVMAPIISVPLVVVHELLHQLASEKKEPMARRGLVKLAMTEQAVIGEHHYNVIRRSYGRPTIAHPEEQRHWWNVVQKAAMGASWEEIRADWDRSFALGDTVFEASIFETSKRQKAEFQKMYEDMAELFGSMHKQAAVRHGMTKEEVGRQQAREFLRMMEKKAGAVLEVALLCQLAAMAGIPEAIVGLERITAADGDAGLEELGDLFVQLIGDEFEPLVSFAVELVLRTQLMYMRKAWNPEANDFFDLLVMIGVNEQAGDVFVTTEKRWKKAAKASGMGDRVMGLEEVKAQFLL